MAGRSLAHSIHGSVGTQAELALQLQGRDAVGVGGHQNGRPEPGGQRQLAGVHDRAGGHRGLATAVGTLIGERLGLQSPGATATATWADKPFWPAPLEEILRARRFGRKTALELDQRSRKSALGSRHRPTPANPEQSEPTSMFWFCTLDLDGPDARA